MMAKSGIKSEGAETQNTTRVNLRTRMSGVSLPMSSTKRNLSMSWSAAVMDTLVEKPPGQVLEGI